MSYFDATGSRGRSVGEEEVDDPVNHPKHYTSHPSGVECIDVVEQYPFNIGNAIKYLWRAGLKGDLVEDLKKARWYIDREIAKREKEQKRLSARCSSATGGRATCACSGRGGGSSGGGSGGGARRSAACSR